MNTKLLYLQDTYRWQAPTLVENVGQDEKGCFAILKETLFYPTGGGQEHDTGQLMYFENDRIEVVSKVIDVRLIEGKVIHYLEDSGLKPGHRVNMIIDSQRRLENATAHTAGHLICGLIMKYYSGLKPIKGYHHPNGSYLDFNVDTEFNAIISIDYLQDLANQAIKDAWKVTAELVSSEILIQRCSYIPKVLPSDKPLRIVSIAGLEPLACGGTHLNTLQDIKLKIRKIKLKKAMLHLSYETTF